MPIYAEFACKRNPVDFAAVNAAALKHLPDLAQAWCPECKRCGSEWSACNPTRPDRRASLSINLTNGAWLDFATGDKGGDGLQSSPPICSTHLRLKQRAHWRGQCWGCGDETLQA